MSNQSVIIGGRQWRWYCIAIQKLYPASASRTFVKSASVERPIPCAKCNNRRLVVHAAWTNQLRKSSL